MLALRLTRAPHRVLLAGALGRWRPDVHHGGPGSPLQLAAVPRPERPPGWVRVAPILAGICASDRKLLHLRGYEPVMSALYGLAWHVIPGHEVVGVVVAADPDAPFERGQRVVVDPTLSCADKGLTPCARCVSGQGQQCEQLGSAGVLAPGHGFGHAARYGGGWGQELVAPVHRVLAVPEGLSDRDAVLAEPTAVAVHAVGRRPPPPGGTAAVIGPGTIGLSLVHALQVLAPDVHVTVVGLDPTTDELARGAGAHAQIHGTGNQLIEAAAGALAVPVAGGRLSGPVLTGGFDVVYDAVGSAQTLGDACRMTRPGGAIVLVGTSGRLRLDWSLVWARELSVVGTAYYGTDEVPDGAQVASGRRRSFDVALDVLEQRRPGHLVTHVFPLAAAPRALAVASAGPRERAVKVCFAPSVLPAGTT